MFTDRRKANRSRHNFRIVLIRHGKLSLLNWGNLKVINSIVVGWFFLHSDPMFESMVEIGPMATRIITVFPSNMHCNSSFSSYWLTHPVSIATLLTLIQFNSVSSSNKFANVLLPTPGGPKKH